MHQLNVLRERERVRGWLVCCSCTTYLLPGVARCFDSLFAVAFASALSALSSCVALLCLFCLFAFAFFLLVCVCVFAVRLQQFTGVHPPFAAPLVRGLAGWLGPRHRHLVGSTHCQLTDWYLNLTVRGR